MNPYHHKKDLENMIKRYVAGEATPEEIKFIEAYYQYLEKGENILDHSSETDVLRLEEENFQSIKASIAQSKTNRRISPVYRYAAAAAIIVILGFGVLYFSKNKQLDTKNLLATNDKALDVLPGVDKAVLTLADGSKVVLDNNSNENIIEKSGLTISKTKGGQLIYKVSNGVQKGNTVAYNTIETAKGNQYQVLLPDGTKVWLNAASSLKYPEVFTGKERRVVLTGEAYFEVAKDKTRPFFVRTVSSSKDNRGQDVEVLGTHFNINSYMDDQSVKTTLLEGSVKVSNDNSSKILKPGEQAVINNYGLGTIHILQADTDDETAWKNGLFRFSNAGLKSILNQIERWYDVKIDYNSVPDKRYNGMVPRNAKLSEVLQMLEVTGNINFEIEENRVLKVIAK
jgi:transmembrane sensor